jgi:hypothetical protein
MEGVPRPGVIGGAFAALAIVDVINTLRNWEQGVQAAKDEDELADERRRIITERTRAVPGFRLNESTNRVIDAEARVRLGRAREENVDAVGPNGPLPRETLQRIDREVDRLAERFDADNPTSPLIDRRDGNEILANMRQEARANILGQGPAARAAQGAVAAQGQNQQANRQNPDQRPEMAYSLNFQSSQSDIFAFRQQMQIDALKDPMQREIAQMQLDAQNKMIEEIQALNAQVRAIAGMR